MGGLGGGGGGAEISGDDMNVMGYCVQHYLALGKTFPGEQEHAVSLHAIQGNLVLQHVWD